MKPSMQMLCRLLEALVWRSMFLAGWVGVVNASAWAAGVGTASSPEAELDQSVRQWVAKAQSVKPEAVTLLPFDSRLQIRACAKALAMDWPFSSVQTVRVRCPEPEWQLYVRVQVPVAPPPPSPAKAVVKTPEPPPLRQVLVAAVPLQRGMALTSAHVRLAEVDTQGVPLNVLEQVSEIKYAEVVRDVRPDTPLRSQDIRPAVLVKRGQMVLMSIGQTQGFQISARVLAMQDGRFGEQIKLKNTESGRLLTGQVKGPNQVKGL